MDIFYKGGLEMQEIELQDEERTKKLDEKILSEIKNGTRKRDIVKKLEISFDILNDSLNRLTRKGLFTHSDIKKYQDEALDRGVFELIQQGYEDREQMRILLHSTLNDVGFSMRRLFDSGRIDKVQLNLKTKSREERKKRFLELLTEGETVKSASKIVEISVSIGSTYAKELVDEGKIERKDIKKGQAGRPPKISDATTEEERIKIEKRIKTEEVKKLTQEETEQLIVEYLKKGFKIQKIANDIGKGYIELRPIIDKVVREGRVPVPEKKQKRSEN